MALLGVFNGEGVQVEEVGEGVVAGDGPGGVVECVEQGHGVYRSPLLLLQGDLSSRVLASVMSSAQPCNRTATETLEPPK